MKNWFASIRCADHLLALLLTIFSLGALGASGCGGDTGPGNGNPSNDGGVVAGDCFSGVFNGATYSACSIGATWDQAKTACETKGGMLAVIMSAEENDYLGQMVKPMFTKTAGVWIGARRQGSDFAWINGATMSTGLPKWASGEPARSPSDCAMMGVLGNGLWGTRTCPGAFGSPTFYLCKFGG